MRAGSLDRKITIQAASIADDGFSSEGLTSWTDIMTLSASAIPVNDAERFSAGGIKSTSMYRWIVRHSVAASRITPQNRLIYGREIFEIVGIKELGRRRGYEITGVSAQ